ncbi:histidine kinase dimerization/phospho-acceptor domain-containing protein [Paenibacillus sp. GCM10027626]|uniref:sensor histidine kinase n=1 Tax=Paenibacillus sp. GCM10027626 TaxID=3273411 RepID=UPI003626663A
MSKYALIIVCAMLLLPLMFPLVTILVYYPFMLSEQGGGDRYQDGKALEAMWHKEARLLSVSDTDEIDKRLRELKRQYEKAAMFWVDERGATRLRLPDNLELPEQWTPAYTIQFMKQRFGGDPFTIVAFIGAEQQGAFMVFELPRQYMQADMVQGRERYNVIFLIGSLFILGLFLFVSFMFFYRIRKRLVRLQQAMTTPTEHGIPAEVEVLNDDEIGRLEQAFNSMILQLEAGRRREAQDEALRRELIAKLSHDLRTPLTTIRGHAFGLRQESLTAKGEQSLALVERKIDYLGQLIENLFSYALLSAGKYPYHPRKVDIVRMTRTLLAGWFPVFEEQQFQIELELPEQSLYWEVDPSWLERVLDNFFQNVLRHAKEGRYIGVAVTAEAGGRILIRDRGPGMSGSSAEKGAGLGLSIVQFMLKEMQLHYEVETGQGGTAIQIMPRKF